jgi:hypothetical protein
MVEIIREGCFACRDNLEEIIFQSESKVRCIESHAFNCCSSLTVIQIPSSVEIIGESAFIGCNSLTEVIFEGNVHEIGTNAFNVFSTRVTRVKLPHGVLLNYKFPDNCCIEYIDRGTIKRMNSTEYYVKEYTGRVRGFMVGFYYLYDGFVTGCY